MGQGANMYSLIATTYAGINLDFQYNWVLDLPILSDQFQLRRLQEESYRFEHEGLPCIFVHGAGVKPETNEIADEFDEYWGSSSRTNIPPYCSYVKFVKMNTLTRYSESKFAELLFSVQPSNGIEIRDMIIITHGHASDMVARSMDQGRLQFHRSVRWLALNIVRRKSHIRDMLKEETCNTEMESLLGSMAKHSKSSLEMTCEAYSDKGWGARNHVQSFNKQMAAGLCGAVASHKHDEQERFLQLTATEESKTDPTKALSDGINRVDHCLDIDGMEDTVSPKYDLQPINFWDGQMIIADRIGNKGARYWLYHTATAALETLVNGLHPTWKASMRTSFCHITMLLRSD